MAQNQRLTEASLDTLVAIVDAGGIPGYYPIEILEEIGVKCVKESDNRAEEYLRKILSDPQKGVTLRITAFRTLMEIVMPAGRVSFETLNALQHYEKDPDNAFLLENYRKNAMK